MKRYVNGNVIPILLDLGAYRTPSSHCWPLPRPSGVGSALPTLAYTDFPLPPELGSGLSRSEDCIPSTCANVCGEGKRHKFENFEIRPLQPTAPVPAIETKQRHTAGGYDIRRIHKRDFADRATSSVILVDSRRGEQVAAPELAVPAAAPVKVLRKRSTTTGRTKKKRESSFFGVRFSATKASPVVANR